MCEVSVYFITYNQRDYIRQALDSILEQKTTFDYEIVLHDDASTDGTTEIVKDYEKRYPDKVRAVLEEENQWSRGIDFSYKLFEKMSGKYVAYCEGDDYWTDDHKLQKQWEALEKHPECDMCACCGVTVTEDGKREISYIRPIEGNGVLTTEQVIIGGGQYVVTAGLLYRKKITEYDVKFTGVIPLDYSLQILGSLRGGIYYIDERMAAYRRNAKGSWSENVLKNRERLLNYQWVKERELLRVFDEETEGRYHDAIMTRLKAYTTFTQQLNDRKEEVLALLSSLTGSRYVWGLGRRGGDFEEFCQTENISIDGACDLTNEHVGELTPCGNPIVDTSEVLTKADNILATNSFAYNDLMNSEYKGRVISLQEFMPYG